MIHHLVHFFHHHLILCVVGGIGTVLFLLAAYCLIAVLVETTRSWRGGDEAQRARAAGDRIDRIFSEAHRRVYEEAARYRRFQ